MGAGVTHAFTGVEAMGVLTLQTRIEMQRRAAGVSCVRLQPVEHGAACARGPRGVVGDEIVDVEMAPPGELLAEHEARHDEHAVTAHACGKAIARQTLALDLLDERRFAEMRPELRHDGPARTQTIRVLDERDVQFEGHARRRSSSAASSSTKPSG